ncbi:hypothetical protein [Streptosporangium sp. NPDC006930]|uniref:hypothetical protein n=1 Tax=Streptosporangium sp. NPDC006930 TaxID=3154783 RepID=UPI00342F79AE
MDGLPASGLRDIRELQRGLTEAQRNAATGRELTEATKGWILRAMPTPDVTKLEAGDVWIYAEEGTGLLRALSQDNDIPLVEFVRGAAVADPAFPLTNATASYNQGQAQTVVDTVENLYNAFMDLKSSLENANHIAS